MQFAREKIVETWQKQRTTTLLIYTAQQQQHRQRKKENEATGIITIRPNTQRMLAHQAVSTRTRTHTYMLPQTAHSQTTAVRSYVTAFHCQRVICRQPRHPPQKMLLVSKCDHCVTTSKRATTVLCSYIMLWATLPLRNKEKKLHTMLHGHKKALCSTSSTTYTPLLRYLFVRHMYRLISLQSEHLQKIQCPSLMPKKQEKKKEHCQAHVSLAWKKKKKIISVSFSTLVK